MRHNGNLVRFPHSPLLIRLFIYFDFAFVHEPLVSGQVGLWRLRQWIMQAALLPWWPSYAVLVLPALHFIHFLPMLKHRAFVWSDTFPDSWEEWKDACSAIYCRPKQTMQPITSCKPWRSLRKIRKISICKTFFFAWNLPRLRLAWLQILFPTL